MKTLPQHERNSKTNIKSGPAMGASTPEAKTKLHIGTPTGGRTIIWANIEDQTKSRVQGNYLIYCRNNIWDQIEVASD
jgi:hypothetical protein